MVNINIDNNSWSNKLKKAGGYLNSALQLVRSHNPRRHSPEHRFRKRLKAGIFLAVIVIVFSLVAYHLADERFSRHLTHALEKITGGEVEISQAEINILSDIRIQKLNVYLPGNPHDQRFLVFSCDDILLEYNPWSIFSRELEVNRIVSIGALLNLSYQKDQKNWNIATLKLKKGDGKRKSFPKVIFRDSRIQYREISGDDISEPFSQQFSGELVRDNTSNIISFKFVSDKDTSLPNCIINGSFDPESSEISAELNFDMEKFDSENLPPNLERFRKLYEAINPRGELTINSLYSPEQGNRLTVGLYKASAGINWMGTGAVLPLNNLNGEIIVTSNETIIKSVQVDYSDGSFILTGSVKGYSKESDINLKIASSNLDLPEDQWDNFDIMESNVEEIDKLKSYSADARASGSFKSVLKMLIAAMPQKNKKIIWETLPTGRLDIEALFVRENGKNNVSGDIQLINTSARHIRFPYRFDGAQGSIHFEPGHIWFGPITGEKDGQNVIVNGKADKNENNKWVIDVDVNVENIVVNDNLYTAFNKIQREVFDLFNPSGTADAVYKIHVVQGQQPQDTLDLVLKNCSGTFKFFPIPAHDCFGKIHWERQKTTFEIENAKIAGGNLQAIGSIETPNDGDSVIDCQVDFTDTMLDKSVAGQLPTLIKDLYDKAQPLGKVSGTAKIRKVFDGHISKTPIDSIKVDTIEHDVELHLSNASVFLEKFPRKIEKVDTNVRVKDFGLNINYFDGEINWPESISSVNASGYIDKETYSLKLDCQQLPMDYDIKNFIVNNIPEIMDKYQPAGVFDLNLLAGKKPGQKLNYSAKVVPHGMQAEFMGYKLNGLKGEIEAASDVVTLRNLSIADNKIIVNGTLINKPAQKKYNLKIASNNIPVDENLKNAFTDEIPLLNDEIGLAGMLSCDAELSLETSDPNIMLWHVKGTGSIEKGNLKLPLETTDISSAADFVIEFDQVNQELRLVASTNNTSANILKRPLKDTIADISYNSKDSILFVDIINSKFCSGKLDGSIKSNLKKSDMSTRLELIMKECDLRDIVIAKEDDDIKGLVRGYVNLLHSPETSIGKFEFDINQGTLGKLPLIAGILNIINFSLPHEGAFRDAYIIGDVVNNKTIFTKMDFHGSAISINGKGEMVGPLGADKEDNGEIDVTFLIEAPQIIKPIPIVGSLFNAVRSGFIHVRATGKFDKPAITPIPLSLIGDIFKEYKGSNNNNLSQP